MKREVQLSVRTDIYLQSMAESEAMTPDLFVARLILAEWARRIEQFPTLAQVDAARTTADDLTPGGPVVVYETRSE
jgi:hypothetical protein